MIFVHLDLLELVGILFELPTPDRQDAVNKWPQQPNIRAAS